MLNTIKINKIKLYAYHGCLPEEGKIGGNYEVNICLETNFIEAAKSDNLSKTIDYTLVHKIVKEEMAIRSKLIEAVALRIQKRFQSELKNLHQCSVEIVKFSPPIDGIVESVSVLIKG